MFYSILPSLIEAILYSDLYSWDNMQYSLLCILEKSVHVDCVVL